MDENGRFRPFDTATPHCADKITVSQLIDKLCAATVPVQDESRAFRAGFLSVNCAPWRDRIYGDSPSMPFQLLEVQIPPAAGNAVVQAPRVPSATKVRSCSRASAASAG